MLIKNKQQGNVIVGIVVFILLGFLVGVFATAIEHLWTAMGGQGFDPVILTCDIMWTTLIYTVVFAIVAVPIMVVTVVVAASWPIWVIPGIIFYMGELIWLIRLIGKNFGMDV